MEYWYLIKHPRHGYYLTPPESTEQEAWDTFCDWQNKFHEKTADFIERKTLRGYRAVRVRIEEVEK